MPALGDRIGPYELVESFGDRAGVQLWRGTREGGTPREPGVALLRVADRPSNTAAVTVIRREYETLRSMDDVRVRRAFAFYAGHGASALEWVDGPSLHRVLKLVVAGRVRLDAPTAIEIVAEVAYALRHAHGVLRPGGQIVHGALSAHTVRFGGDGRVVLVDFGVDHAGDATPRPPEVEASGWSSAADQWTLGALAVHLLTGAPLNPDAADAVADGIERVERACLTMHRPVARMLSEDPRARYDPESALIRDVLAVNRYLGQPTRRPEIVSAAMRHRAEMDADDPATPFAARTFTPGRTHTPNSTPRSPTAVPVAPPPEPPPRIPTDELPRVLFQAAQPLGDVFVDDGSHPTSGPLSGTGPSEPKFRPRPSADDDDEADLPLPRRDDGRHDLADLLPLGALIILIGIGIAVLAARMMQ